VATIISIDDPADPRIAAYRNIREHDLVGREELFVAEGEVVVRVLAGAALHQPLSLFLAEKRLAALADVVERLPGAVPVYVAPQAVMDGIAGFPIHRGILALGRRGAQPSAEALLAGAGPRAMVLLLCAIANHDNIGGLFRNAAAFGADFVLLDSDCCDPLYRKAIRVSAGNALKMPFARLARGIDPLDLLQAHGFEAIALSPTGAASLADAPRPDRLALLFGAEGPGLPEAILRRARTVRIPIASGVDSLNVATASGIVLHHFAERG
jgi:tRNA G18 (ribose-2'-O)-methylase SpoU